MARETTRSKAEELLLRDLKAAEIPPLHDYDFHPDRLWKFDFAYPSVMVAVEVDGSGYHTSDKGKRRDQEKRNAALEMGWKVLCYPANSILTNKRRERIVEQIKRVVCGVCCEDSAVCVLEGD